MKKFALLLLLVSLTRIGVAYADTTNPDSGDYLFNSQQAAANLNQVLALLVGPKGDPGPAGVAGKDGLIGLNGVDGLPGAPGAAGRDGIDGKDGKDGIGIASAQFTGAQGTCTSGGTKFTDAAGTVTYACNGANGLPGTPGSPGADGAPGGSGGGGGGGFTYAQGEMTAGACDKFIVMKPVRTFTIHGFGFKEFKFGDRTAPTKIDTSTGTSVTLYGDIESACNSLYLTLEFFTKSAYIADADNGIPAAPYTSSDHIVCRARNTIGSYTKAPTTNAITLSGGTVGNPATGDFACTNDAGGALALIDLDTNDYTNRIGLSIGQ